jgi:starch synthase
VQHYNPHDGTGTGFKFGPYEAGALLEKIREALYFYGRPEAWRKIQENGMRMDNSWSAAAEKYIELYQRVIEA